jgi:protein ImuA
MKVVTSHHGLLRFLTASGDGRPGCSGFTTGLAAVDALLPASGFRCGAIHELLPEPAGRSPDTFAALVARAAPGDGLVVWNDPAREVYPPALAALGLDMGRLVLLRPRREADGMWAVAECLRCPAVSAVVTAVGRLSAVDARRLQLAAEGGGGVGVFVRPRHRPSDPYAAATRWAVRPVPGCDAYRRWVVRLVHGPGGRVDHPVSLEVSRDGVSVRAVELLADRPAAAAAPRTAG